MVRKIALSLLFLIGTVVYAAASEIVTFKGEEQEMVTAKLTKPQNKAPSPTMILLHGCLGFDKHYDTWVDRLASWGYVALQIDSFGSRGKLSICSLPSERAQNLCAAKSYLSGLPFVDDKTDRSNGVVSGRRINTGFVLCKVVSSTARESISGSHCFLSILLQTLG